MCGLCGVLTGEAHWTAAAGRTGVFAAPRTRRAERLEHVRAVNAVLAAFTLKLDDWQGTSFVLSGPTGRREIVDSLAAVWDAAAKMLGRPIDPLDDRLLARLAAR